MKKLLLFFVGCVVIASVFAQKTSDWQKNFPSKINWYKMTDAVKTTISPLSIRTSVAKSCAIHPNLIDCVKAVQNNYFTPAFMLLYIELD